MNDRTSRCWVVRQGEGSSAVELWAPTGSSACALIDQLGQFAFLYNKDSVLYQYSFCCFRVVLSCARSQLYSSHFPMDLVQIYTDGSGEISPIWSSDIPDSWSLGTKSITRRISSNSKPYPILFKGVMTWAKMTLLTMNKWAEYPAAHFSNRRCTRIGLEIENEHRAVVLVFALISQLTRWCLENTLAQVNTRLVVTQVYIEKMFNKI